MCFFISCKDDGEVYIAYDWNSFYGLDHLYTTDQGMPYTIYDEVHYQTDPCTWYVEWSHNDPSEPGYYWIYYIIEADEASGFADGADRYFTLEMILGGFYNYTYYEKNAIIGPAEMEQFKQMSQYKEDGKGPYSSAIVSTEPINKEGMEKIELFTYVESSGGYTLRATYGMYTPKE